MPVTEQQHELITNQTAIGWEHLFRGRWATDWSLLERSHKQSCQPQYKSDLTMQIAKELLNWVKLLWTDRSKARHGQDMNTKLTARREAIDKEVRQLYQEKEKAPHEDQSIFQDSVEVHLQQPMSKLENWISCHRSLIKHSVNKASQLAKAASSSILKHVSQGKTQRMLNGTVQRINKESHSPVKMLKQPRLTHFGWMPRPCFKTSNHKLNPCKKQSTERNTHGDHPG